MLYYKVIIIKKNEKINILKYGEKKKLGLSCRFEGTKNSEMLVNQFQISFRADEH